MSRTNEQDPIRVRLTQFLSCASAIGLGFVMCHAHAETTNEEDPTKRLQQLTQKLQRTQLEAKAIESVVRERQADVLRLKLTADTLEKQMLALGGTLESGVNPTTSDPSPLATLKRQQQLVTSAAQHILHFKGQEDISAIAFLANYNGQTRIFTSAELISNNPKFSITDLNANEIKAGQTMQCPARIELVSLTPDTSELSGFEWVAQDEKLTVGDDILVLSINTLNSEVVGNGGKIRGVGPDLWELDAELNADMIGAPVLSLASGRVIGIVTPNIAGVKSDWARGTRHAEQRSFAARLDRIESWETIELDRFCREATFTSSFEEENHVYWLAYMILTNSREKPANQGNHSKHSRNSGSYLTQIKQYPSYPVTSKITRWAEADRKAKPQLRSSIMASMANDLKIKQDLTDKFSSNYLADRYKSLVETRHEGIRFMKYAARRN